MVFLSEVLNIIFSRPRQADRFQIKESKKSTKVNIAGCPLQREKVLA
jgi:hypothetical protein